MWITVLFVNRSLETQALVVMNFEDGAVIRHSSEGSDYDRCFLVNPKDDGFQEIFLTGRTTPIEELADLFRFLYKQTYMNPIEDRLFDSSLTVQL